MPHRSSQPRSARHCSWEGLSFLTAVSGGILSAPLAAEAQQAGKVYRIGFLSGSSAAAAKPFVEEFRQGLHDLGYVEGRNIIDYRWAEGQQGRLPELATDLAPTVPELIVVATSPAAMAAQSATTSIPIVMVNAGDPIYHGLATSLARPGQNFTRLTSSGPELAAEHLALLSNRLPTMFGNRLFINSGGLMAYSIDFAAPYRRAVIYVEKILKGAKPGDLPIEEPTKYELVINLKAAKALGLTIPLSLLWRADQVIE